MIITNVPNCYITQILNRGDGVTLCYGDFTISAEQRNSRESHVTAFTTFRNPDIPRVRFASEVSD